MKVNFSFDPLHFIAIVVCGVIAGFAGNTAGAVINACFTSSVDAQQLYRFAGDLMLAGSFVFPKVAIAGIVAGIAMARCATTGKALLCTVATTAGIGLLFTLIFG